MSKMDDLRAMREARYAAAAKAPARPAATAAASGALCGHKAIGGRSCTRDAGHSEKSHRYA
jgi:hypothetical protein